MTIHPIHAIELASIRHRELVARADEFRAAARAGTPQVDCRVPTGGTGQPAACRPDPRPAAAGRIGRRPRFGLPRHRTPHRVR